MLNVAHFPHCCGADLISNLNKECSIVMNGKYCLVSFSSALQSSAMRKRGITLAILNETQIAQGMEEILLAEGFRILVDGFYNSNENSQLTLYGLIHHPKEGKRRGKKGIDYDKR